MFAATLARAAWLQGVRAEPLSRLAATQQRQTVELPARRGTIFDRNGVLLALGEQATTVYADPTQLKNARTVALAAERTLGVDAESIYPELQNRKRSFVYLERKADSTKADGLRARKLPGVGFYPEERRRYPQGGVGSEIQLGEGIVGVVAEAQQPIRISGLLRGMLYGQAARRRAEEIGWRPQEAVRLQPGAEFGGAA